MKTCPLRLQSQPQSETGPPRLGIGLIIYFTVAVAVYLSLIRALEGVLFDYSRFIANALPALLPLYACWLFRGRRWRIAPGEFLLGIAAINAVGFWTIIAISRLPHEAFVQDIHWWILATVYCTAGMKMGVLMLATFYCRRERIWAILFATSTVALGAMWLLILQGEIVLFAPRPAERSIVLGQLWGHVGVALLGAVAVAFDAIQRVRRSWLHWFGVFIGAIHVGNQIFNLFQTWWTWTPATII